MWIVPTALSLVLAGGSLALAPDNARAEIEPPGPPRLTIPGVVGEGIVWPGGIDNRGPGSIGTVAPGATGASKCLERVRRVRQRRVDPDADRQHRRRGRQLNFQGRRRSAKKSRSNPAASASRKPP